MWVTRVASSLGVAERQDSAPTIRMQYSHSLVNATPLCRLQGFPGSLGIAEGQDSTPTNCMQCSYWRVNVTPLCRLQGFRAVSGWPNDRIRILRIACSIPARCSIAPATWLPIIALIGDEEPPHLDLHYLCQGTRVPFLIFPIMHEQDGLPLQCARKIRLILPIKLANPLQH